MLIPFCYWFQDDLWLHRCALLKVPSWAVAKLLFARYPSRQYLVGGKNRIKSFDVVPQIPDLQS